MRVSAAFILLLCTSTTTAAPVQLDPRDGVVLPAAVSKELLNQCSRGAPQGVTGTWLPTAEQIRELENRLPSALGAVAVRRGERYAPPAGFRRQYAGFVANGRKIVYVNTFPRSVGGPDPNGSSAARQFDWHRHVVGVCDGGPAFFGVEYDPTTKTFSHFEFNGLV